MSLPPEMQATVDMQNATENNRAANQAASQNKQVKLEMMRMAKEILIENRRTQAAADVTDITASAVTAVATDLTAFVNS